MSTPQPPPDRHVFPRTYVHEPHPHIAKRHLTKPRKVHEHLPMHSRFARFNTRLALNITSVIGSMWCAYTFVALSLPALPQAWRGGAYTMVQWTSQSFIQLVLLPILLVQGNIQARAADERAEATYRDAEAILHEALAIQQHMSLVDAHLTHQDRQITHIQHHLHLPPLPDIEEPPHALPHSSTLDRSERSFQTWKPRIRVTPLEEKPR